VAHSITVTLKHLSAATSTGAFLQQGSESMRSPKERETAITMSSEDHSQWHVWTDDPYMMRRLDRLTEGEPAGNGKRYTLRADQLLLRKGKRQVSDAQRRAGANNLKTPSQTKSFHAEAGAVMWLDLEA
jgi:hypothetical protein